MKRLLLLALFMPLLSFGQKIEFTEMGGISIGEDPSLPPGQALLPDAGLCSRFTASYYFTHFFSLGAVCEYSWWDFNVVSVGATADFQFRWAYMGLDVCYVHLSNLSLAAYNQPQDVVTYKPTIQIGWHLGLRQRLARRLYIKEQLGSYYSSVSNHINNEDYVTRQFRYTDILVGLSYRFPIRKTLHDNVTDNRMR